MWRLFSAGAANFQIYLLEGRSPLNCTFRQQSNGLVYLSSHAVASLKDDTSRGRK
jgi:hypothetical protein